MPGHAVRLAGPDSLQDFSFGFPPLQGLPALTAGLVTRCVWTWPIWTGQTCPVAKQDRSSDSGPFSACLALSAAATTMHSMCCGAKLLQHIYHHILLSFRSIKSIRVTESW